MDRNNSHYQRYMLLIADDLINKYSPPATKWFFLHEADHSDKTFFVDCLEAYCSVNRLDLPLFLADRFPYIQYVTRVSLVRDPVLRISRKAAVRVFSQPKRVTFASDYCVSDRMNCSNTSRPGSRLPDTVVQESIASIQSSARRVPFQP